MQARTVGILIQAYCLTRFKRPGAMESIVAEDMAGKLGVAGSGTHKYIPADRLSADLGLEAGRGVYGYHRFPDGSFLLQTCDGPNAIWAGDESKAEWLKPVSGELI